MGKIFVTPEVRTPAERVREALDDAERLIPRLRKSGSEALELPRLFDQIATALEGLEQNGVDIRAEYTRFKNVQERLRSCRVRFLREAGTAYQEARMAVQPDRARWWWYIDEIVAQERKQRVRRLLIGGGIAILVLAIAWVIYDRFIAPPPNVRQAYHRSSTGERLVTEGDLRGALAEFEQVVVLTPDDPNGWVWLGVIHTLLGESQQAEAAFQQARSLYGTEYDFLVNRSMAYVSAGDLDRARADIEQAIWEEPEAALGYYVRANIEDQQGNCMTAIADLERASELAQAAGNTQLDAVVRVQLAYVTQSCMVRMPTPTPFP